ERRCRMNRPETVRVGRAWITPEIASLIADLQENPEMAEMYCSHLSALVDETIMDPERDDHDKAQDTLGRIRALHMLAMDINLLANPDLPASEPDTDPADE
ncbi:MAG: hypothetical protein K2H87_01900, partial [Duncaniella sp.]|nr:hypothetical protein [Duncaniella sp.]